LAIVVIPVAVAPPPPPPVPIAELAGPITILTKMMVYYKHKLLTLVNLSMIV